MAESLESRFQNLHEFVTQARTNLDRNNWDYLIGGSETETTLARNRLALDAVGFRPRVLRDVSNIDCSVRCLARSCASRYCARRSARSKFSSRAAARLSRRRRAPLATA